MFTVSGSTRVKTSSTILTSDDKPLFSFSWVFALSVWYRFFLYTSAASVFCFSLGDNMVHKSLLEYITSTAHSIPNWGFRWNYCLTSSSRPRSPQVILLPSITVSFRDACQLNYTAPQRKHLPFTLDHTQHHKHSRGMWQLWMGIFLGSTWSLDESLLRKEGLVFS